MTHSPTRLKEIRERLEKATPGPWEITKHMADATLLLQIYGAEPGGITSGEWICEPASEVDGDFIAHAPSDIAWLLTELENKTHSIAVLETRSVGAEQALISTRLERDRLEAALDLAKESLEQIHKKLTPCIPKMDGRDSWQIHQRFIDDVYIKATKAIEKILAGSTEK